jgi:uncharacterized protein (AIM24 family)
MKISDAPIKVDITDETFAGVTYHLRGALVPELQIELSGQAVMFEHHTLLWKEHQVGIELHKLPGGIKRKMLAGLDFFITKSAGSGRIAFSRDWPGQCIPLHLSRGQEVDVREHHFLAATDNIDYTYERVKGVRNMLLGGSGFWIDKFKAGSGDAIVWVSGQGNVFEVELDAGDEIDVEAGGWLYKDPSVTLTSHSLGLKTGFMAGDHKMTWNRFGGPGKVAIQTMYVEPFESEGGAGAGTRDAAAGGVAGAVISGLLRG